MRTAPSHRSVPARASLAAAAVAATPGFAACGADTAGTEAGADVEDVSEDAGQDPGEDVADEVTGEVAPGEAEPEQEPLDDEPLAAEPYVGPYDAAFAGDVGSYVGQVVNLSADVDEVLTPTAFTIAGTDDTTVEALLVVGATEDTDLSPGTTVAVTGTVQESFTVRDAEERLRVDLDDTRFAAWEQQPYVIANSVEVAEDAQG
jgi:hypothetical protein